MESIRDLSVESPEVPAVENARKDVLQLERDFQYSSQRCGTTLPNPDNVQQNRDGNGFDPYIDFKNYLEKFPLNPLGSLSPISSKGNSPTKLSAPAKRNKNAKCRIKSTPYIPVNRRARLSGESPGPGANSLQLQCTPMYGRTCLPSASATATASGTLTKFQDGDVSHAKKLPTEPPKSVLPYITLKEYKVGIGYQFLQPGNTHQDNCSMLDRYTSSLPEPPVIEATLITDDIHPFSDNSLMLKQVTQRKKSSHSTILGMQRCNKSEYSDRSHGGPSTSRRYMGGSTRSGVVSDVDDIAAFKQTCFEMYQSMVRDPKLSGNQ